MPEWLVKSLLVIFVIHFVMFARIALRKKDRYYWLVSITFFLLVISFSTRLWFESLHVFDIPAYWIPRVAAWTCTLVAILLAIRRRVRSRPLSEKAHSD